MLLVAAVIAAKPAARWIDRHIAGGRLKDASGSLWWHEDWGSAQSLPRNLDASWLTSGEQPLRVAHAIGASGTLSANRLDALEPALRDGLRLIEVDLWLDAAGELRCQHDPGPAAPLKPGDCTLRRLLPRVAAGGGWVVLDIKSDFVPAGEAVLELVRADGLARHVVFQLYRAEQLAAFAQWSRQAPLAAPIVTTYGSHRTVQHIADHLQALNVQAMTLPLEDLSLLSRPPAGIALLVHPVHDCADWHRARRAKVRGFYTLTRLACDT